MVAARRHIKVFYSLFLTKWYHYGIITVSEGMFMTKHRKTKETIVQSTMRIPHSLWERINQVADTQRLSMAQAVERALFFYCSVYGEVGLESIDSSPIDHFEWMYVLTRLKEKAKQMKKAEQKRKGEKR